MKKKKILIFLSFLPLFALTACSSDDGGGSISHEEKSVTSVSEGTDKWTYYSLEDGKTVGTSKFGDAEEDSKWASRDDWDIAVSGDLIRTNGGNSGSGRGGIVEKTGNYDSYSNDPEGETYVTDKYE